MKRLVSDTGPILHLHEAGALHLLPLIGEVIFPPMVLLELRVHAPSLWAGGIPAWARETQPPDAVRVRGLKWRQAGLLHGGEADALALAETLELDWFLTDDAAARLMADTLGIEVHGSLGVVLWTAAQGLIGKSEAGRLLTGLEHSSLWLSPRVRVEARAALEKIFGSGQ